MGLLFYKYSVIYPKTLLYYISNLALQPFRQCGIETSDVDSALEGDDKIKAGQYSFGAFRV